MSGSSPDSPEGSTAGPGGSGQPGWGSQPGYGTPPAYGATPGYGYMPPGPGGMYPGVVKRSRWRMWLGIGAASVIAVIVIASVVIYLLTKPTKWTVTAPPTVAGLSRDTSPIDQSGFGSLVTRFRSDVTSVKNYGSLTSTVSAIYTLGSGHTVGLIGFNGKFNVSLVLKSGPSMTVSSANAGPHGGVAECGTASSDVVCQWSTPTTVGIVVVTSSTPGASQETVKTVDNLMIRIRDSAERSAHGH